MTVYCESANFCQYTTFDLPKSGATLHCTASYGCSGAQVVYDGVADDMGRVEIHCGDGSTTYSCDNMVINAEKVYSLDLVCQSSTTAYNYPCDVTLNADHATNVVITAEERRAANYDTWNVRYAHNVTINARGNEAIYQTTVQGRYAGNMQINLASDTSADYTARYSNFYVPVETTFNCYGYGCYYMMETYRYESNSADGLQFNVDGCDVCDSVTDCIYDLDLNCNGYSDYWSYGNGCSSYNNC